MTPIGGANKCSRVGCEATYKPHRWGQTKAHEAGWFFQKNGDAWCPDHTPSWVKSWRAKKKDGEK